MQQLNPSEISEIIKSRIDNLEVSSEAQNEGTIVSVSDGIIRIHGLADVMYGEMIEFDGGIYGGEWSAQPLSSLPNATSTRLCRCTPPAG